jgi:arabinofuranosyltransferase
LAAVGAFVYVFSPREERGPTGRSFYPALVFLGAPAATGLMTFGAFFPGQSQRYLIQWLPMGLLYGVIGVHLLGWLAEWIVGRVPRVAYGAVVAAAVALTVGWFATKYPPQIENYVLSVKNINEMQVALGKWVDENTPADAIVATNDIGAIAFFGHRPIVDTIGLIDPEVVRRKKLENSTDAMMEYFKQRGVTYAILFPRWHPDLLLRNEMAPVYRVVLDDNVICGDRRMLVMRLYWDPDAPRPAPPAWAAQERFVCRRWQKFKEAVPF